MPISREEVFIRDHLQSALSSGSVKEGYDLLEQEQILIVEEMLNDYDDELAKEEIMKYLSPTPYKERGMYL